MVGVARVALYTPNNTIIVSPVGAGTAKYHSGGDNASGFSTTDRRGLSPTTSATSPSYSRATPCGPPHRCGVRLWSGRERTERVLTRRPSAQA